MFDDTESACNILYLNATSRHGRWHFSHLLYFAFLSLVPLAQFGFTLFILNTLFSDIMVFVVLSAEFAYLMANEMCYYE